MVGRAEIRGIIRPNTIYIHPTVLFQEDLGRFNIDYRVRDRVHYNPAFLF